MGWVYRTPYVCRLPNPGKQLYPPPIDPVSPDVYFHALAVDPNPAAVGQLYVHLPFCESLCTFCPIHKELRPGDGAVNNYIQAVIAELEALARQPFVRKLPFESVYFGGGTPSALAERALADLANCIAKGFRFHDPQWTFEGHVRSLTRDKMRFVKSLGFNRMSTGVQTFDPQLRRALNLQPTEEEICNCIRTSREEGFEDFNIDLMYNLPGQTLEIWERDLTKAVGLNPSGMDVYEAVVARTTPLYSQVRRGQLKYERKPSLLSRSYELAEQILSSHGYRQRNLFAWDRPGFRNIVLGSSRDLLRGKSQLVGAGLSAYSLINGAPFMNNTDRLGYIGQVRQSGVGVMTHHSVPPPLEKQRFMIMSLHDMRLDTEAYRMRFAADMEEDFSHQLKSFRRRNLIRRDSAGFSLTALGRAWATTMAIELYDPQILAKLLRRRLEGSFFIPSTYEEEYQLPLFAVFHPELILRNWPDYKIIRNFIADLRRRNPGWVKEIFSQALRLVPRWGIPIRGRYHYKLIRAFIGSTNFYRRITALLTDDSQKEGGRNVQLQGPVIGESRRSLGTPPSSEVPQ